jgi:hypothetical protein
VVSRGETDNVARTAIAACLKLVVKAADTCSCKPEVPDFDTVKYSGNFAYLVELLRCLFCFKRAN